MGKAFIVPSYLESPQPEKLAEYAGPARTAIEVNGGRFIVLRLPAQTYKDGLSERTILLNLQVLNRQWPPRRPFLSSSKKTTRTCLSKF